MKMMMISPSLLFCPHIIITSCLLHQIFFERAHAFHPLLSSTATTRSGNNRKSPYYYYDSSALVLSSSLFSFEQEVRPWYKDTQKDTLPFSCTGCGKCCKTKGTVYMSPKEIEKAVAIITLDDNGDDNHDTKKVDEENPTSITLKDDSTAEQEFLQKYAQSIHPTKGWIELKSTKDGCIFLDQETNYCKIYEARPLQCSTYPFWPRIMESESTWNDEVRIPDDDDGNNNDKEDAQESSTSLSSWSFEEGGCEGMRIIDSSSVNSDTNTKSLGDDSVDGVTIQDAHERLEFYKRYKRQFPYDDFISIEEYFAMKDDE